MEFLFQAGLLNEKLIINSMILFNFISNKIIVPVKLLTARS